MPISAESNRSSSVENDQDVETKHFNLTNNHIQLIIDRVRAKTLFDVGYNAAKIKNEIFNNKYTLKTLYGWNKLKYDVQSIIPKKQTGRKSSVTNQIQKKIFTMATKKKLSTRKIAQSLKNKKSKSTIWRNLRYQSLRPFRRRIAGAITDIHKKKRLEFALLNKDKAISYWESILYTDSKIFLLHGGRNSQNDVVWAKSADEIKKLHATIYVS